MRTSNLIPQSELLKPICVTCSTQFDGPEHPKSCHICDDPRQYVPPSGQSWTTLKESISSDKFKNIIVPTPGADGQIYTIATQPKLGIGQRAHLIRTPQGNIVWDLVAYIDDDTVNKINELGGIQAIVISHPHFYSTFTTWSEAFGEIPVYLASEDESWISRHDSAAYELITRPIQEIIPESGVTAIKVGGHFPGSMVLHWRNRIFTADSIMITPIPLPPDAIYNIIKTLAPFDFEIAHGAFSGQEFKRNAKRKLIQSADIVISIMNGIKPGEREKREFWKVT
ncbi:hypothetical protein Clacol_001994 [Clathrus columnatus]|uniref:Metallo-beta-lactamase domain-containing protein n=1 Tax=Clathrus columnatus TaxID=1419009 RepID=A0AAV5A3F3_9AGAM|nr:hypothetical protein Clacol_001994 [Clathrus columnatus]